jgi:putative addiction module component (TIGR02574 family)
MSNAMQQLLDSALALPEKERAELASVLIRSLEVTEPDPNEQAEIDAAWAKEIRRRVEAYQAGKVRLIDADEVFASLRVGLRK